MIMNFRQMDNIAQPLIDNARLIPNRIALISDDVILTYEQLNRAVNREAAFLRSRCGVTPGTRVAYLFSNCEELIRTYYAVQKIGAISVPINFKFIGREIAYLVNASEAAVLVYDASMEETVSQARQLFERDVVLVASRFGASGSVERGAADYDLTRECESQIDEEPVLYLQGGAVSRIQYTGGSTGVPKGAARTHSADLVELEAVLDSNGFAEEEHPVVLVQCPMEHHGGHNWFTMALSVGATLVVCGKFDPTSILSKIEKYHVTDMIMLPPITFLRLLSCPEAITYDLSSVRLVQSSAGSAYRKVVEEVFSFFPNAVLNYGWGQTESGAGTSLAFTREMLENNSSLLDSVGRPMLHVEMRVVDDEGNDVGPGISGEALVKSDAVMEGYWNQPQLTEQSFSNEWLKTGDMMYRDNNGYYYMVGRKKDVIKSGGENVFASEVENAICSHPEVVDCVVFAQSDPEIGESVSAVVQKTPGSLLSVEELQAWCKSQIASYKKPRHILFVESLNRDESGKVNKGEVIKYFQMHYCEA